MTNRRKRLIALAHIAASQLGWDDELRLEAQERATGCASCARMTEAQLVGWLWHLKGLGADVVIPTPGVRGGEGVGRPTPLQMGEIERLALLAGFEAGLGDLRLEAFVRRTAGVDGVRFLSRDLATDVITGLRRWLRGGRAGRRP